MVTASANHGSMVMPMNLCFCALLASVVTFSTMLQAAPKKAAPKKPSPDEKGYDHKFVFGEGVHSSKHGTAIFPEAMRWIWRDFPK